MARNKHEESKPKDCENDKIDMYEMRVIFNMISNLINQLLVSNISLSIISPFHLPMLSSSLWNSGKREGSNKKRKRDEG